MRERGFLTIAQDQASCAVYGMPKAAAAIDAAVQILSWKRSPRAWRSIRLAGFDSGQAPG